MGKDIKILLVDDHQVVRDGLCSMLAEEPDMEVVGQSSGGEDAIFQIARHSPNVILMDIKMPRMDGIQLANLVKQKNPDCNIIMLTLYDEYLVRAIGAGASGYLLKDISREELIQAIRQVHRGEVVIGKNVAVKPDGFANNREAQTNAGSERQDGPETLLEEVQLVIPPPAAANQVIRFITKVEQTLHTRILQVAGSWDEGTAITAVLPRAVALEEIICSLKTLSGIENVEEAPPKLGKNSGLMDKALNSNGAKSRAKKTIFVHLKTDETVLDVAYQRL
ncbi:MAG: response regulator transcription factor [Dehalococcoidales bacterium]|nr:response regulator transcription factor [Dehalococcoidales bacterium]